jgi:hypothetical protein
MMLIIGFLACLTGIDSGSGWWFLAGLFCLWLHECQKD